MPGERKVQGPEDTIAAFQARIDGLRQDGVYSQETGEKIPWAEATEESKVASIVWETLRASMSDPALPGEQALVAIERCVDYDKLPPLQREMLQDVREQLDAGQLAAEHQGSRMDRTWISLNWITGIETFERWLERYKAEGLYDLPSNIPWAEVPETEKVSSLVGLASHDGPPGEHALAAIEREVDYDRLPPWRRQALEGIRARLDAGELEGHHTRDLWDRANYALRLAELEARVEDYKHFGGQDNWGVHRHWQDFSEVEKLDRIVWESGDLHLHSEPRLYEIIDRDVDLTRVPDGRRRGIESNRETVSIGPEEYQRRKEAKYAPPNEAAAAFKSHIEETLWTTCFTDGATYWADWSDLSAGTKLHEISKAMDWDRVPESYFRLMVERELKIEDLPQHMRAAVENPKANRGVFAEGFEDGIDASEHGHGANHAGSAEIADRLPWNSQQRAAMHRQLFDTVTRVQYAEFIMERALDPNIAMRPSDRVREVYFQEAEKTWDSFRQELEFRSDAEVKENLDAFRAKETQLGGAAAKTLMDHLQAGGLFLNAGAPNPDHADKPSALRDTTRNLVEAIWLDVWPRNGAIVDFGLVSQEHYEALYYPVREGEITPEALDAALGKGEKITALARSARSNPHRDITFSTDWDFLIPEPESYGNARHSEGSPGSGETVENLNRPQSPSEIARDHSSAKTEHAVGHDQDRDKLAAVQEHKNGRER
jgi:hypothetical protein